MTNKKTNLKPLAYLVMIAYVLLFILTFPAIGVLPVSALFIGVVFAVPTGYFLAKTFIQ